MGVLIRHFFERFFDKEAYSPQGDATASLSQALGFLAAPGAILTLLFLLLRFRGWELVLIRCFFLSLSMVVMGFLVVIEWEALFPDRRDFQILTPLPVPLGRLFLAKALAFGWFLGIFLVDVNFFSTLLWGGMDGGTNLFGILGAHLAAVFLSGLFAALAMAALQGLLLMMLPAAAFRKVSLWVQTLLMGALVMLLVLSPKLADLLPVLARQRSPWAYAFPPYWFAGLYEQLRPAVGTPIHFLNHPPDRAAVAFLLRLGRTAPWALAAAAALFFATYLPGYRRHARKVLEAPQPNPSGPGRWSRAWSRGIDRWILRDPVQIGVFHFINQTITRSMKHRLFLATYAGCGAAIAVLNFGSGRDGLLRLPLTLSFILVSALRAAFNFPSELGANWAFQTSESDFLRDCLAATRKWIIVCAIAPLALVQAVMEFRYFAWPAALFHLAFVATLAMLLMEILFLGFRKAPFACSYFTGKINLVALIVVYVFGFTMYSGTMASFEGWLEGEPAAAAAFFAAAGVTYALAARWRNRQLEGESILDYVDEGDPTVRTLELSA